MDSRHRTGLAVVTVEPHCGQKWNCTGRPPSDERTKRLCLPVTEIIWVPLKQAPTPNTLPVRR
jgi:hypothetical protein